MALEKIVLDMDSSVSETYGQQEGTAYNGHFGCSCYHPLFCFNQFGDLEGTLLREGKVHSAKNWKSLEPIVARDRERELEYHFRGIAAFANPGIYEYLESEKYQYAIRLPANDILYQQIEHLLKRPVGRPPKASIVHYHEFLYQAESSPLESDNLAREADQYRCESDKPSAVHPFPDGGNRCVEGTVRRGP
jgi:hypothetical protein